ncbi:MAG: DEAD/DEAH box helicase [Myxococcales bacterium]|nr:DEAD/DEAH box helicase [Myxococcales bacterium]MBK7192714.1 DEAD/DEAH box helicase [Myxococcales bacterium]MBP6846099.1 DEAD/DEAH box helicase [Kofleriaceae bacterium]
MTRPLLIRATKRAGTYAVFGTSNFGYPSFNAATWPDRLFANLDEAARPPSTITEAELDAAVLATPLESLLGAAGGEGEKIMQETRRALARLEAMWLLCEDRYRLLDAQAIDPLAHQASLVEHVLKDPNLRRVLIADEVGLGKTIEAALIVQRLIESRTGAPPRVLYLTQAGLVDNVVDEFVRLGLSPRRWTSWAPEARLDPGNSDPLVVASMHRAVFQIKGGVNHLETVARSGPWDVLIIDEAHHLSDWSAEGTDPQQRMKLVRRLVDERMTPGGRLLLLSGTPHQGHGDKFQNLLRLLCAEGESDASGRVIYRIKDDIRDWDGQPLFPIRDVRPPTMIECGPDYRRWLELVHRLLSAATVTRAAGWRLAQALQWCASSPQAGLAYLVRLTLRTGIRSGNNASLRAALGALRPYRGRSPKESVEDLEAYLRSQLAELDEDDADDFKAEVGLLSQALNAGVALIERDALRHKLAPVFGWLEAHPDEKFVVFAQPVETVYTLKQRLEMHLGAGAVSLIVGGQDRDARRQEIERFRRPDGARVLVSSRSGGEGINLQISRRLIHFDVPWNPMEMEQRVGRVHRYGSDNTVVVETIVMEGSREIRILDRCRARLGQIVKDIDGDRFELHYSRTMALIPLAELALLMAGEGFGPLTPDEEARIDRMVQKGYETLCVADADFRQRAAALRGLDRGPVQDEDLEAFVASTAGAKVEAGWRRKTLVKVPGAPEPQVAFGDARVFRLPDGSLGFVGRDAGLGLMGPTNEAVRRLGLNDRWVASKVRALFEDDEGAGSTRAPVGSVAFTLVDPKRFQTWCESTPHPEALRAGALVVAYGVRRLDLTHAPPREVGASVRAFVTDSEGRMDAELTDATLATLVRMVRVPRPKRTRATGFDTPRLRALEDAWVGRLRVTRPGDPVAAVFPIAAIWIQPATGPES